MNEVFQNAFKEAFKEVQEFGTFEQQTIVEQSFAIQFSNNENIQWSDGKNVEW